MQDLVHQPYEPQKGTTLGPIGIALVLGAQMGLSPFTWRVGGLTVDGQNPALPIIRNIP